MKPRVSHQKTAALTLVDVLVIVAVVMVAFIFFINIANNRPHPAYRAQCLNNLKQIAIVNVAWANDHNGKFPMQVSETNWGAKELALAGDAIGVFRTMSNELVTPRLLFCPSDKSRVATTNFAAGFSAKNISYFIGLDASTDHPHVFLSGDDNFAIGGVPTKSGLLELSTNISVAFTPARHSDGGNIVFADGGVQQVSNSSLTNLLRQTGVATNRLAIP